MRKNYKNKISGGGYFIAGPVFCAAFIFLFFTGLFFSSAAFAHKVMIFAWVDGDTIFTQSKFSGGKKAKGARVLVYDPEGNLLVEGKTDEKGEFSFKAPKKIDLNIVLEASMGHMAKWKIPAGEITEQTVLKQNLVQPNMRTDPAKQSGRADIHMDVTRSTSASVSFKKREIKELIDKSLDKKLAPVINMLADLHDQKPKLSDVIGGLGYIFGLVGVALYFANRK